MSQSPTSISSHVPAFQSFLSGYLAESLPKICTGSDDWWKIMVRSARLKGAQKNRIRSGSINRLEHLDLVSLCGLLAHHWSAITRHNQIEDPQNEGKLLCEFIINLRNRLSHEGIGNRLEPEEELHAVLGLTKLCKLLKSPDSLLEALEKDKTLLMESLSSHSLPPPSMTSGNQPEVTPVFTEKHTDDHGIPLEVLDGSGDQGKELDAALSMTTFIGIDFGTSTTVASRVFLDPEQRILTTEPIPIPQLDRLDRTTEDYLVPSCISYVDDKVLVGRGAAELKPELTQGVDT